jgi:hypothetical protein
MSQDIADMPGIEAAMERFSAFEKSDNGVQLNATTTPDTRETPPDAQAAAKSEAQTSESTPSDTRATAEVKTAAEQQPDKSQTETKPETKAPETKVETKAEAEKSRYAKSQERLTKTWESVNAEKATVAAEKAKLETERAEFVRKQAEFQTIQQQAQQPQYKPEDYLSASNQKKALADHQRAEALRLEDAGKFAEAEKLKKLAGKNDALSEDLAEHAENLKKNPPAGFVQKQQQYQQAKQAWTLEAAKAFPDLAKNGSPFQQTVAGHLNALAKTDPQFLAHPSVIYHVARLTAAEAKAAALQADAARVPVLVKESESLRAKIKELEALTSPVSGGGVAKLGGAAVEDDAASLRQAAAEAGALFR